MKSLFFDTDTVKVCRRGRKTALLFLIGLAGAILMGSTSTTQAVNHRPVIKWKKTGTDTSLGRDQQLVNSTSFGVETFTVFDPDGALGTTAVTVTRVDSPSNWCTSGNVTIGGSYPDYTVTVGSLTGNGSATITITVSDGSLSSSTSFTIASVASAGPGVELIADQTLVRNSSTVPLSLATEKVGYTLTAVSSDTGIAVVDNFVDNHRIHTLDLTPKNTAGVATITVTLSTTSGITSVTSFVVTVANGTPPGITGLPSYYTVATTSTASITFGLTGNSPSNLDVRAISSNPAFVPNSGLSVTTSGSTRTLTVTPTSGATAGAATITLAVSDQNFTRYAQMLFVLRTSSDQSFSFTRARGLFVLDSGNCDKALLDCDDRCASHQCIYETLFHKDIDLRDLNIRADAAYIDGFTLRVPWPDIEKATGPEDLSNPQYDFHLIDNAIMQLEAGSAGQHLSIIIQGEPDYIAERASQTWCDDGSDPCQTRAVPWDQYLRARWHALMQAMSTHSVPDGNSYTLGNHPVLTIINPSLPGGNSGIRDPEPDMPFGSEFPGYSRLALLLAIEDYLDTIQDNFQDKLAQIGFWNVKDDDHSEELWSYLRDQLFLRYNGIERPRVGYWQEDLAASRLSVNPEYVSAVSPTSAQYTSTPGTTFAAPLANVGSHAWVSFQTLDSWAGLFSDMHWPKMKNGSANDAMEAAYSTYNAQYFELYVADVDDQTQTTALTRWHDYFQSIPPPTLEVPAGLNVVPTSLTSNDVSWFPVVGATSYTLTRYQPPSGNPQSLNVTGTLRHDNVPSGAQFAYKVSANGLAGGSSPSPWVATFRSDSTNDGYVNVHQGVANDNTSSGIRAGQGLDSQVKGITSFLTGAMPDSGYTILSATLRVQQGTDNVNFDALGAGFCTVEIKNGYFGASGLGSDDLTALATDPAGSLPEAGTGGWAELRLDSTLFGDINTGLGPTQFRQSFPSYGTPNVYVGWYPGDVVGSEPQLKIRYTTP